MRTSAIDKAFLVKEQVSSESEGAKIPFPPSAC